MTPRQLVRFLDDAEYVMKIGWVQALRQKLSQLTIEDKDALIVCLVRELRQSFDSPPVRELGVTPAAVKVYIDELHPPRPEPEDPYRRCGVYFIQCGTRIKIGYSYKVTQRLRGLRTASPDKHTSVGWIYCPSREQARALEACAHREFAGQRVHREWFDISREVAADFIQRHGGVLGEVAS